MVGVQVTTLEQDKTTVGCSSLLEQLKINKKKISKKYLIA